MNTTHFDGDASISRNLAVGGDARLAGSAHVSHDLTVDGWLDAPNIKGVNRGFYESVTQLRQAYPNPMDGWLAAVGASSPFITYTSQGGEWRPMVDENGQIGRIDITMDMARLQRVQDDINRLDQQVGDLGLAVGQAQDSVQALEGHLATERVTATYVLRNTTNTISGTQCVTLSPGHHRMRLAGLPQSVRLQVIERELDYRIDPLAPSYTGTVFDRQNMTDGAIVEFDNAWPNVCFRTFVNSSFTYRVEEIESETVDSAADETARRQHHLLSLAMPWRDKVLASWGDSVMAISNGNGSWPFYKDTWLGKAAYALGCSRHYGRSVGGQTWRWTTAGGGVTVFVDDEGRYINRVDGNPSQYAGTLPSGATATTRGCACSWDRMCKMFPAHIRSTIDCVLMMYHNDAGTADQPLSWVEGSTADPEWAASDEYQTYGGDYNITTVRGGIASAVMKMQALMPQAVIVLCTPLSGRGETGRLKPALRDADMEALAETVRDMGRILSVPVIDMYATCGINGLNRTRFISDTIHPYLLQGQRMATSALVGGLKTIMPPMPIY